MFPRTTLDFDVLTACEPNA